MALVNTKKTGILQLRLTPEMKQKLKYEAKESNTTIVSLVENALLEYFEMTPTLSDRITQLEQRMTNLEIDQKAKENTRQYKPSNLQIDQKAKENTRQYKPSS